eukprot:s23_g57.t1
MLSVNKEERSKWNWDWLSDPKAKKPMSAYVRELTNSAASTSAATLGIQTDMAECKGLLKSLLETMERAIAAEKTFTVLLQQSAMPVSPSPSPVAPTAPETPAPPTHPDGTPMGAPSPPDMAGTGSYEAYGACGQAFPPQPPQQPQANQAKGGSKGKPAELLQQQSMAPPMRPPATPPMRHASMGDFQPGWGNSFDSHHRAPGGSVSAGVHGGGEIPVPSNLPPEEIVVHWSGFAPMVAPNMNNDAVSNPPLTYELPGDVPNLKTTSVIGVDRQSGRRRRLSPEGKQLTHRNAASAAYAPKGWTQSVNTLLFHRVYENL